MHQAKPTIILWGETITLDKLLIQALQPFFMVNFFSSYADLSKSPLNEEEDLVLWELSRFSEEKLNAMSSIKKQHPEVKIVVQNGGTGTEIAAEILKAGASDIFPQPFNYELLVDRFLALLSLKDHSNKIIKLK